MADYFLSTGQVAEYLGMSRDALMHQIRSGDFLEPDVVVGDRGIQGWSAERVEEFSQDLLGQGQFDEVEAVALINEVRAVAEVVRGYGDCHGLGLDAVPTALLVTAAEMESDIRSRISSDVHSRRTQMEEAFGCGDDDPVLLPIQVDAPQVISAPISVTPATCVAELAAAARRLGEVTRTLPKVHATAAGRRARAALSARRAEIAERVAALEITDPGLRKARLTLVVEKAVSAVAAAGRITGLSDGERSELQKLGAAAESAAASIEAFLTEFGPRSTVPHAADQARASQMLILGYHELVSAVMAAQALVEGYGATARWGPTAVAEDDVNSVSMALLECVAGLQDTQVAWQEFWR